MKYLPHIGLSVVIAALLVAVDDVGGSWAAVALLCGLGAVSRLSHTLKDWVDY